MPKSTLSIERAKRYAKAWQPSVSELIGAHLNTLPKSLKPVGTSVLSSLRGTLKKADLKDYRKYLARKNR